MNEEDLSLDELMPEISDKELEARGIVVPSLEGLLEGMTLEEMEAMGRQIFDGAGEEEAVATEAVESPEAPGELAEAAEPEAPENVEAQGASAPGTRSVGMQFKEVMEPSGHALAPELRPALLAELQNDAATPLNPNHLQLLDKALGCMQTEFDGQTATCANPDFVAALRDAINQAAPPFAIESPLEGPACHSLHRTLLLAVALAEQRRTQPEAMPWCDVHKFFADYQRLLALPRKEKSDEDQAYCELLARAAEQPLLRTVAQPPRAQAVLELVRTLPNFAEPITHVAEQLALHRMRQGGAFQPTPMLLLGPPGVGKSHFAQALAKLLGSTVHTLQLASQSSGWVLGGLDRGWSGARPGQVFDTLAFGDTLAPVVVLDEIDKVNPDGRNHPLGPLYALLEPVTSAKFRDEFVEFTVDASQVIWIATANEEHAIPPALLSRFAVFRIEAPAGDELAVVLQNMYREAVAGIPGVPECMPLTWQAACRGLSLRACRQVLGKAAGRAVLRAELQGREMVELMAQDLVATTDRRPRMGFG